MYVVERVMMPSKTWDYGIQAQGYSNCHDILSSDHTTWLIASAHIYSICHGTVGRSIAFESSIWMISNFYIAEEETGGLNSNLVSSSGEFSVALYLAGDTFPIFSPIGLKR